MREFIIGTDWWTDCDDAAAMRIAARSVKNGLINVRCVGINACMEYSVPSLVSFLHLEGVDFPVGIDRDATDFGGNPPYQKRLAERCDADISNCSVPDAAGLYISELKKAEDTVEIVEIGYPNVLAKVVETEPELFARKVSRVWMMAGKWDEPRGKENNFARNARSRAAAHKFLKLCPVPVTFLGWEVGYSVIVGGGLAPGDHLKEVFEDHHSPDGRCAWDPMLMNTAIIGDFEKAGFSGVRGFARVDPVTGENEFEINENGAHTYLVKTRPDEEYRAELDKLIASE